MRILNENKVEMTIFEWLELVIFSAFLAFVMNCIFALAYPWWYVDHSQSYHSAFLPQKDCH